MQINEWGTTTGVPIKSISLQYHSVGFYGIIAQMPQRLMFVHPMKFLLNYIIVHRDRNRTRHHHWQNLSR